MMKPATDGEFPWTGIFFGGPDVWVSGTGVPTK